MYFLNSTVWVYNRQHNVTFFELQCTPTGHVFTSDYNIHVNSILCVCEGERCWLHCLHNSNETLRDWLSGSRQRDARGCTTLPPYFKGWQIYLWKLFALDNGSLCAVERGECVGLISRAALHLYEALPKDLHLKL